MRISTQAVSDLAGVSDHTLHHHDAIGLVSPVEKTASGYRLYTEQDLRRLQQVLFLREEGFSSRETAGLVHLGRPRKTHALCAVNFPADA